MICTFTDFRGKMLIVAADQIIGLWEGDTGKAILYAYVFETVSLNDTMEEAYDIWIAGLAEEEEDELEWDDDDDDVDVSFEPDFEIDTAP